MRELVDLQDHLAILARVGQKVCAVHLGSRVLPVLEAFKVLEVFRARQAWMVLWAARALKVLQANKARDPWILPQMIGWSLSGWTTANVKEHAASGNKCRALLFLHHLLHHASRGLMEVISRGGRRAKHAPRGLVEVISRGGRRAKRRQAHL